LRLFAAWNPKRSARDRSAAALRLRCRALPAQPSPIGTVRPAAMRHRRVRRRRPSIEVWIVGGADSRWRGRDAPLASAPAFSLTAGALLRRRRTSQPSRGRGRRAHGRQRSPRNRRTGSHHVHPRDRAVPAVARPRTLPSRGNGRGFAGNGMPALV
jgi:hypothetical protein